MYTSCMRVIKGVSPKGGSLKKRKGRGEIRITDEGHVRGGHLREGM